MQVGLFALLFDHPMMLWGLSLLALPLLLQLLLRRQVRDVSWGAMKFLQRSLQQHQRQMRIEQWLQLLLRSGIIAALVLGMANPRWESSLSSNGSSQSAVHWVFVLDTSLSMRAADGVDSGFTRARQELLGLLQQSPPGSSFRLMHNCEHQERVLIGRPVYDAAAAQLELELVNPTWDRADWRGTLRDLLALVEGDTTHRSRVVFVSDFQASDWTMTKVERSRVRRMLGELQQRADLMLLDVGTDLTNAGITQLSLRPDWQAGAGSIDAVVEVANHGSQPLATSLDLLVDDRPHQRKSIELAPGEHAQVQLPVLISEPGEHQIEVQLPTDSLLEDNRRYAVLPVVEQLRILIVDSTSQSNGTTSADYVRLALPEQVKVDSRIVETGPRYSLTVRSAIELAETDFESFDTVMLFGVSDLADSVQSKLRGFLQTGGGLVIFPGEQWESVGQLQLSGELDFTVGPPAEINESALPFTFQSVDTGHPLVSLFEGHPEAGLETTRIYKYVSLTHAGPAWRPVVRYSTSAPAVLTRPVGSGTVVLVTTSPHPAWGSWVLWPSFVPMMREMVTFTSSGKFKRTSLIVGDAWTQPPLESTVGQDSPAIQQPDQRTALADWSPENNDWRFAGTFQPGIYSATNGPHVRKFTVNVDSRESDLRRISMTDLQRELFAGINVQTKLEPGLAGSLVSSQQKPGQLGPTFVILAIILWILEWLRPQITQFVGRRFASQN